MRSVQGFRVVVVLTLAFVAAGCGPDAHPQNRGEPAPKAAREPLPPPPRVEPPDAGISSAVVQTMATDAGAGAIVPACETRTLLVGAKPLGYSASGEVCAGLRQGIWQFTNLDGKKLRRGTYQDDLETGQWTFWYASGVKRSEGSFNNGQRVGPWFRNHENGQRSLQGSYDRGLRNGRWQRWHESGQLYEDRIYVAGSREGVHHKWSPEGLLQYTRLCKDDECEVQCRAQREKVCPPLNEKSAPN